MVNKYILQRTNSVGLIISLITIFPIKLFSSTCCQIKPQNNTYAHTAAFFFTLRSPALSNFLILIPVTHILEHLHWNSEFTLHRHPEKTVIVSLASFENHTHKSLVWFLQWNYDCLLRTGSQAYLGCRTCQGGTSLECGIGRRRRPGHRWRTWSLYADNHVIQIKVTDPGAGFF